MTLARLAQAPAKVLSHGSLTQIFAAASQASGPSEFRPVTGADEMQSGGRLLVEAYAAIWLVLLVLVLVMWRRTRALEARIALLDEAVRKTEPVKASSSAKAKKKPASDDEDA